MRTSSDAFRRQSDPAGRFVATQVSNNVWTGRRAAAAAATGSVEYCDQYRIARQNAKRVDSQMKRSLHHHVVDKRRAAAPPGTGTHTCL